jgi:RNA polymerase sigma-70 factor (ECF subfamily)
MSKPSVPLEQTPLSDFEVVNRVLSGDTALFALLIRRYDQRVYRFARAIVRNEADAEEIVQETYLRAFQHLRQFEGRARFSTWLLRIALNQALARIRQNARFADLDGFDQLRADQTGSSDTPEQIVARSEIQEVVKQAIDRLPPTLRTVLMLRAIEGMNSAEAAELLEISEDNLNVRLHRAKTALRNELAGLAEEVGPHLFLFEAPRCQALVRRVLDRLHEFAV